jgi:hypothetical protein
MFDYFDRRNGIELSAFGYERRRKFAIQVSSLERDIRDLPVVRTRINRMNIVSQLL